MSSYLGIMFIHMSKSSMAHTIFMRQRVLAWFKQTKHVEMNTLVQSHHDLVRDEDRIYSRQSMYWDVLRIAWAEVRSAVASGRLAAFKCHCESDYASDMTSSS